MKEKMNIAVTGALLMGAVVLLASACKHVEASSACCGTCKHSIKVGGFNTSIEDGRLWVLKDGEEKAEKHVTLIGVGPMGMTIKAANRSTALEYLAMKPGFNTSVEDGRLWVLKDGEEKAEKHITLIGAGPVGMTIKAANKSTALEYLATKAGFTAKADEHGRIWIFADDEEMSMPEKHVTRVGAGPQRTTLKALSKDVLDAYRAAK